MQERYPAFHSLLDKECFSYTPSSIDSDKLWPVTMVEPLQFFHFMPSSDNCTHALFLIFCRKGMKICGNGKI